MSSGDRSANRGRRESCSRSEADRFRVIPMVASRENMNLALIQSLSPAVQRLEYVMQRPVLKDAMSVDSRHDEHAAWRIINQTRKTAVAAT